jgi:hypothetical protein
VSGALILKFLARYWLHIAIAAALLAAQGYALRWAWVHGGDASRLACAQEREKLIEAALKDMQALEAQRNAAQRKADELAKPQREVAKSAKANPSGCSLAKPTGDKLREQIRKTNDAIRAVP